MKHTLHISGMHCPSCELLITDAITSIPGCKVTDLSHRTGKLIVDTPNAAALVNVEKVIVEAGYHLGSQKSIPLTRDQWITNSAWLLLAFVLVYVLFKTAGSSLVPQYETLTLPLAFIIGLVASISTCLAVTGGIIVGYTESVNTTKNIWTQGLFHLGRIGSFLIGGALLGIVGTSLHGSVWFNAGFSIVVGIVLLYLGLQILGFVSNITQRGFHLPLRMTKGMLGIKNPDRAWLVGALTFLLPCGFTQSMQLVALQSGSAVQGALIMGAFALGTLPVLFALGIGTKYIKDKLSFINPLIAALLVAFGAYTIFNGYTLAQSIRGTGGNVEPTAISNTTEREIVAVGFDGSYFVPSTIVLPVGKQYTVRVTPSADGVGCKFGVVIPGKGEQMLKKGVTFDILVDGSSPKTIPLVCSSMGMSEGKIVVQ